MRKHYVCLSMLFICPWFVAAEDMCFRRGDVDADGRRTVTDAILILRYVVRGELDLVGCEDAADADDQGEIRVGDAVLLLNFLFSRVRWFLPLPRDCGRDRTEDELTCRRFVGCGVEYYGIPVADGEVIVHVAESTRSSADSGVLGVVKERLHCDISEFEVPLRFGLIFFAGDRVQTLPAVGNPAEATVGNVAAALMALANLTPWPEGSCVRTGLLEALKLTQQSSESAGERVIIYIGGGGGCGPDLRRYLDDTLETVTAQNAGSVTIHCVGTLEVGRLERSFLSELATRNGGVLVMLGR